MTEQEKALLAEIAALKAENARLAEARAAKVTLRVAEKGGVSIYGMGRWPVTLYAEQWAKVFALAPQITKFIADNEALIKTRSEASAAAAKSA